MTEIEYEAAPETEPQVDAVSAEEPVAEQPWTVPQDEWQQLAGAVSHLSQVEQQRQLQHEYDSGQFDPQTGLTASQFEARLPLALAEFFNERDVPDELRADIVADFEAALPSTMFRFGSDQMVVAAQLEASVRNVTEGARLEHAHEAMVRKAAKLQYLDPEQVDAKRVRSDADKAFKELLKEHTERQSYLPEHERSTPDTNLLLARAIDKAVSKQSPFAENEAADLNLSPHYARASVIHRDHLAPPKEERPVADYLNRPGLSVLKALRERENR